MLPILSMKSGTFENSNPPLFENLNPTFEFHYLNVMPVVSPDSKAAPTGRCGLTCRYVFPLNAELESNLLKQVRGVKFTQEARAKAA
jgi:hypothetical protein